MVYHLPFRDWLELNTVPAQRSQAKPSRDRKRRPPLAPGGFASLWIRASVEVRRSGTHADDRRRMPMISAAIYQPGGSGQASRRGTTLTIEADSRRLAVEPSAES